MSFPRRQLTEDLVAHVLSGNPIKTFPHRSIAWRGKTLNNCGLYKYYLTREEWAGVKYLRSRKGKAIA